MFGHHWATPMLFHGLFLRLFFFLLKFKETLVFLANSFLPGADRDLCNMRPAGRNSNCFLNVVMMECGGRVFEAAGLAMSLIQEKHEAVKLFFWTQAICWCHPTPTSREKKA